MQPEKIVKHRKIPTKDEVLVEKNQIVDPDTLIARGMVPNQDTGELRLHQSLNIDPQDVKNHIVKHVGDFVDKEQVVAIARSFFLGQSRIARSPINGKIEAFSTSTGRMIIRGLPKAVEVFAYIRGVVTEIFPEEGAIVDQKATVMKAYLESVERLRDLLR